MPVRIPDVKIDTDLTEIPNHLYRAYISSYVTEGYTPTNYIAIRFDVLPIITSTPCGVWIGKEHSLEKWQHNHDFAIKKR